MDVENFEFKLPPSQASGESGARGRVPEEPAAPGLAPAGFNERFLAYAADTAPFLFGAYYSFALALKSGAVKYSFAAELKWKLLWVAAFLLYETIFASGGRATLGKYLMGIRVVHADGENYLSLPGAFARAVGYLVSSVLLNLGYVLALFTRDNRALHDYLSQSRVISVRERGDLANSLVIALSWAILAIMLSSWGKQLFFTPSAEDRAQILAARTTVSKIATLEEVHKSMYGSYTDDMKRLAYLTRNVEAVRREIALNIERDTLALASDGRVYIITARARDKRKTEVRRSSAPPKQPR